MRKCFYKKGVILILAYSVVATLVVLAAVVMQRAVNEVNLARRNKVATQALYIAESGIESVAYLLAYNIANYLDEPVTADDQTWTTVPNLPTGFLPGDYTLDYTCTYEDTEQTVVDDIGVTTFIRHYKLRARATSLASNVSAIINQIIERKKTFTFQHAVFYVDDLEMLPGANMTLSGRIHSNDDIYIDAETSALLTVDSEYLYSAGNIYNKRKDNGSRLGGDVSILVKDSSPASYEYMEISGVSLDSDNPNWTDGSQARWGGTVKSSVHGVTALASPSVASIQPDGFYADNAGLKITKKTDGTWQIYSGGVPVPIGDFPSGTITESSFIDRREGTTVTVTDIDVSKLNSSGYFPSNGLLYATREDASSSQPNGVRFKEGSEINHSLTIVSNDPVYLQGDFNNTSKKAAAVICDAVNLLSNSWDDSHNLFSGRNASGTEINIAFISGIVPTPAGGGNYSGGIENYPRLHENWSGVTLTIRGSFVQLWNSDIADGQWTYGSPYYTAPYRNWDYDSDFNNSGNLPPFTPFAVETERVVWWKE